MTKSNKFKTTACVLALSALACSATPAMAGGSIIACNACQAKQLIDINGGYFNMSPCTPKYQVKGFGMFGYDGNQTPACSNGTGTTGLSVPQFLVKYICPSGYTCVTNFSVYDQIACSANSAGDVVGGISISFYCGN
jgi:hypothetical protein